MKLIIRKTGTSTRYELSCSGWKAFVKDNNLKEGDICIFELIDVEETTFQVFFYRNTDSPNCPMSQGEIDIKSLKSVLIFPAYKRSLFLFFRI